MGNPAYQEEVWDEMINGKIILMSPRPSTNHNRISSNIYSIFRNFLKGKTCEAIADGMDLYLSETERYVPDGMIVCKPDIIKPDGVHGAPDLVVEVLSPSTARNDRGRKKDSYEAATVQEYWIVEPISKTVEVYLLRDYKLVLDDVYTVYPDYLLEKMNEAERAAVKTKFKTSLYDDLLVSLDDVFERTF